MCITGVAAVAAGVVVMAMSGSASALCIGPVCNKEISLGIRNSSKTAIKVQICPKGHSSDPGDTAANPCDVVTETYIVGTGQRHIVFNTNPLGIIITPVRAHPWDPVHLKTLHFYASNPYIGLPYFRAQGHKVALAEGEEVFRTVEGVHVGLRRYHDEDRDGESVKLMRIEIVTWPGAA